MDLGSCPKCGGAWVVGDERCRHCRYEAIGAGLSRLPKKKKKYRRYIEPGGSAPFLTLVLAGLLGFGAYKYQPWNDDWEAFRALFSIGRHHSLKGTWDVVETMRYQDAKKNVFSQQNVAKGSMTFDGKETVKVDVQVGDDWAEAKGHYLVDGVNVKLAGLKPTHESDVAIPRNISLSLAWSGPNQFLASISDNDVLYMRRKGAVSLAKLIHMQLTKAAKTNPNGLRGIIAALQKQAGEASR
jgi:hypothetical protein